MKKSIFLAVMLGISGILGGCAHDADYNPNAVIAFDESGLRADKPLQKLVIYTDSAINSNKTFKPSTALGKDDKLSINLGDFASNSTKAYLSNYFRAISQTTKFDDISNGLVVIPDIKAFEYGFFSADGMYLDINPYVEYDFRLSIFKNGKQIYSKKLSKDEKVKGEKVFFGGGGAAYATIAPIFQNALINDLKRHANEIISVINAN